MLPATEDPNTSLEHIMASDLYPKKALVADDDSIQVPFPILPGESVEFLGKTDGGIIALSNFRLFVRFKEAFINIPLGLIETIEYRDIFYINIFCKDAHSFRCTFSTNESCLEWYKRLTAALHSPKKLQDVFAFAFHAWCIDQDCTRQGSALEHSLAYQLCKTEDSGGGYTFGREVERMGFDLKTAWRICYVNDDYKACSSYPRQHLVPACMTDKDIKNVANFRAAHRFPSVVWRSTQSGAVIARSSQPEVGWLGWRNMEDERLLQAISAACALNSSSGARMANGHAGDSPVPSETTPKKMLIIDARSYTAAWANRAKGGGCECIEYYPNCEIQFMSLANIHTVRKSFYAVRTLCALGPDQPNWLASVESTKWLSYIGLLLRSAVLVVNAIDKEARPVLVHCSDGWDRTPQLVALAELMLDPHYRTIEGFRVLVEREWLSLGHKFADRCGNALTCEDINERCPVFLQWLDCVHQLQLQFPCAFQFNEAFLVKLAHHTYSGLFGTFLCNTTREREDGKIKDQTISLWSLLLPSNRRFVNLLYKSDSEQVLRPSCHMRHLQLWQAVYLSENAPAMAEELFDPVEDDGAEILHSHELPAKSKTRSCDDIPSSLDLDEEPCILSNKARRLSDPQVATDPNLLLQSIESVTHPHPTESAEKRSLCSRGIMDEVPSEQISNGVSSETLTEGTETVCEDILTQTQTVQEDCPHSPKEKEGEDNNTCDNPASTLDEDGHDTSQYGIARIDSPHTDRHTAQPVHTGDTNLHLGESPKENGLLGHINGSTDTLTEEHMESGSVERVQGQGEASKSSSSKSSQKQGAIGLLKKDSACHNGLSNGHSGMHVLENEMLYSKVLKNGHHVDHSHTNGHTNNRQTREANVHTPFRLEDVLSKLDIESLLDSSMRDGMLPSMSRGSSSGREDGAESNFSFQCRTPNCSTGPPTPGTELKSCPWYQRHQSNLAKHLDCDGLTSHTDPVQSRLSQIEMDYQLKINQLQHQLQVAKAIIYQYTAGVNGTGRHLENGEDMQSTESADSGEHGSMGAGSTAASDVSWEQVEERDAHMTLWVPDHAVTHCAGCDQEFWIVRRKHHCRNCGQVFCHECTQHAAPLPEQQLAKPQRLCVQCFRSISDSLPAAIAEGELTETLVKEDGAVASC